MDVPDLMTDCIYLDGHLISWIRDVYTGVNRSPLWNKIRKEIILEIRKCEICGGREYLQVHHKKPFHLFPELELVRENLCVLCEHPRQKCHFYEGHLGNWRLYNEDIDLWILNKIRYSYKDKQTNESHRLCYSENPEYNI